MHGHNGRTHTNGLLHNAIQNTNLYPHNGIDNQAFTHTDAQNANALTNTQQQQQQQQNPNILIQPGAVQGGAPPPAVQVSLNTLPQTSQPNGNAQAPTIHVNLNSYPANTQQPQQDSSLPLTNSTNVSQFQHSLTQTTPGRQSVQSYSGDPRPNGHVNTGQGQIPTGYSHFNANMQAYQQGPESHQRSDRESGRRVDTPSSDRQQMPWDQLRGTPAYPNDTSDSTEYTTHPPIREARRNSRPQPQSQTASRSRTPPRRDASSSDRNIWNRLADLRRTKTSSVPQFSLSRHTQRSSGTQTESAQADIRGLPVRQNAPRQEATHSNNPQALPLISQQASVGRSAVSQGPATQQGLTALQGADTRALADPNHLQQAHMAQQHRAAPIQTLPQGLRTQTQPAVHSASQPRQGGSAPVARPSEQPNPSNLTQAALKAHTENARVFKSRRQQTQAALLHAGQQAHAPTTGGQQAPAPPPVIPLAHFQTLPRERTQHKSPARGPQPPRPPVNIPTAQRPRHRSANHHHRPANGQRHAHVQGKDHGHNAHPTHAWQQQAHRGRPR
ncbi:serine/arginine repetitive matrix protein 2 isoform X1 [Salarias fasciatus]|uniref:serine/arginine repetitive matrix protein 2 isoform X1 n=1 Tax=Salarias fasciatus TaxID=181472 RepID=UPI00117696E0|nr:sialic acid-binding Ig-like lectin 10 isoform X1 [Salarias fasciatus]